MKKIVSMIVLLVPALAAFAQNTIMVQAPNLVALDEQFNVTFIIEGEEAPSDFQWTPGDDFQLVWGPQRGSSTSISIVNGKKTKSAQTTYTYILKPYGPGRFSLGPASASLGKERISSRSVSIEVVSGGSGAQQSQQGTPQTSQQGTSGQQSSPSKTDDIFLKMYFSKTSAVVGETITATLKLYQRVNIAGFENARFPSFDGFWSQESAPSNIQFTRENVNDRIYESAVIRTWTLIPQHVGELRVEPAELVALINVRAPRASTGSIFDSFFQDEYRQVRKTLTTPAVSIRVNQLPSGAPASFGGAVGNFKMSVSLTRDSLKTHDAASLKVAISGKGNLSMISAPKVNFPPDFEVYDTKTTDAAGSKTFEYPFIPRSYGDFELEPVEFTYYDIASGKYVTLYGKTLPISVAKGAGTPVESAVSTPSGVIRKDVRDLGSDIRFIVTKPSALMPAGSFFTGSLLYWLAAILLVLASAVIWAVCRVFAARRADVVGAKGRSATKMARKRLSRAGEYLRNDLHTAFYEELHKTLLGFVSDKLNMDAADMSKDNIAARLCENGVDSPCASEFVGLLDACEFARYAPASGHEAMNSHYESAVGVISSIDERMKRKPKMNGAAALAAALMLLPLSGRAMDKASADSLWTAAASAYADGRWQDAAGLWLSVADAGLESADLYYNLGNSYFKADNIAYSVLYYEKALKLDPSHKDARFNLEYVSSLCQDRIDSVPEFFLRSWARRLCWMMPSDSWAVFSLIFLALMLAGLLLFLLKDSSSMRKTGFYGAVVCLVLCIFCASCAFSQKRDCVSSDSAVIVRAVVSVKSSPGSGQNMDLFVLHEGTKVKVIETVGEWCRAELSDGRQGWIKIKDIAEI